MVKKMKNISINKLKDFIGKEVQLNGWIYNLRSVGKIWFAIVRDGTGFVQCVVTSNDVSSDVFELESSLTQESSVTVKGIVQEDSRSDLGVEILVKDMEVIHIAEEYPIALKEHGVSFLMDNRHLWLRSKKQYAIMKVRQNVIKSIRDFFDTRDFVLIDSPMFTGNAVEGTTTLFETEYFNRTAYLTQSGQLYQEAGAMAFGKTYCFGPCFRAEKSKTRKHLTEFWMVEPEMAFYDLKDNMDLAESFIKEIIAHVYSKCKNDIQFLSDRLEKEELTKPKDQRSELSLIERIEFVINNDFKRISYTEAFDILRNSKPNKKKKFKYPVSEWGIDFQSEHERFLVEKHFKCPVIVYDYPAKIKAFYMRLNDDQDTVRAMDILFPGIGEIVGGSQREERLEVLKDRIKKQGIDEKELWWYLDLRKYGTVKHSGFGLGLERLILFITGMNNIRDVIPFPRTPKNAEF